MIPVNGPLSKNKFCATKWLRLSLQPNGCINMPKLIRRDAFHAIADPTRRAILVLMAVQPMTAHLLANHFHTSRQAISKHIQVLHDCDLVKPEQNGRGYIYHFNPAKLKEIDKWLSLFRKNWDARFNELDELLKSRKNKKS